MGDSDTVRAGLLLTQLVELTLECLDLLMETVTHRLGVLVGCILKKVKYSYKYNEKYIAYANCYM